MRLHKLEIRNIRGIPELTLYPDGKNLVIWGPNGSGKSAIVDSIDFLLTGKISRLIGKGTRDIALSKHGPHIDHKPTDAWVSAVIKLTGSDKNVEMTRSMANPTDLNCKILTEPSLQKTLALAERGQHVLTRREILKYITAEASTRAQEIQQLLNVSEVEDIRKALVGARNALKQQLKDAAQDLERKKASVKATVQQETYDEARVLEIVNGNRSILKGENIETLLSSDLKKGLSARNSASDPKSINLVLLDKDIQNLLETITAESQNKIAENDRNLRDALNTILSDKKLTRALSQLELTKRGIELIDESGDCPLCNTPWPAGELREHLDEKIAHGNVAEKHKKHISELSAIIVTSIETKLASVQKVIQAAKILEKEDDLSLLQSWFEQLEALADRLANALDKYPRPSLDTDQVQRMLAPRSLTPPFRTSIRQQQRNSRARHLS